MDYTYAYIPRSQFNNESDRNIHEMYIPRSQFRMEQDRNIHEMYIPKETIINIVDNLDMPGIEAFFTTNKELYSLVNEPDLLKHISDTKHLPYVSSFSNLVHFNKYSEETTVLYALEVGDIRLIEYYKEYISYRDYPILSAVKSRDINIVKYLMNISSNKHNKRYFYHGIIKAIKLAIRNHDNDIAKYLLGYIKKERDFYIFTKEAGKYGNIDILRYLIEELDIHSLNAIESASSNGHMEIVKYFIEELYSPSTNSSINTTNLVKGLYSPSTNSSINTTNLVSRGYISEKAILKAMKHHHYDIVKYLLQYAMEDLNSHLIKNTTGKLLTIAAERNNFDIVKLLLSYRYTVKSDDIIAAILNNNIVMAKYLLSRYKGNYDDYSYIRNKTRHMITEAASTNNFDMVKFLLSLGCKIHSDDIIAALKHNNTKMAKYLLSRYKGKYKDIIDTAASLGNLEMIKYLHQRCATEA